MDRRKFRRVEENNAPSSKGHTMRDTKENEARTVAADEKRLAALRELGNHLQVKAEKMRLLARAGEGLDDEDFNPFATLTIPARQTNLQENLETEVIEMAAGDHASHFPEIPPTKARERRRQKKTKHKRHGVTTVDIKQYRPGYNWNKGGRVKELRIRTLARKFLNIWKHKVFGRVTPSQARAHYHKKLVKKTFSVWHNMWWEVRKEWRLFIRAECHHRYVLWRKTFQAWREFIDRQRIVNSKRALAEQHASGKMLRSCWDAWLVYVACRRTKRDRHQVAVYHHQDRQLKSCWERWVGQHELVLHRQHLKTVGLQFWAYRVQAQARLQQRRASVMNQFRVVRHHNRVIVGRCFHAWLVYWARRRQKLLEKEYAVLLYERGVVARMFGRWRDGYRFKQEVQEQQERIQSMGDRFLARRVFLHWRHYVTLKHEAYEREAMAEEHYIRRLMIAGLSAFRLCAVQRKIKLMRQEMADQLRYTQLLRWGWNSWLARCDNNEELRLIGLSQLARKHYRLTIQRKCMLQLQRYCVWRQHRQDQYTRADAYFYMRAMPQYLFRWKVFVHLMKTDRENNQNMLEFRRENLLARYFYSWVNQFEFSKENRMNERMAILQADSCMLRSFFIKWKRRTIESQQDGEKQVIAIQHHNEVLCQKHLKLWISYIHDLKSSRQHEVMAARHHCRMNMKLCFDAWKKYVYERRGKTQKTERARRHYGRVLCRKMVAMWLHYVDMQRCIARRADAMYRRKCAQTVCISFHTWRHNVSLQIQGRDSEARAVWHYTHCILTKVFKAWHRYAAIHAYKKSETRQWVESARQHINLKLQQVYFTKWVQHHEEHVDMRLKYERAVCHHSYRVKVKVIYQWKLFTQEEIRKSLLQKQCDWFLKVRLTARCFITWKHALSQAEEQKQRTNLALWHWCLNLHRKVLIGWYTYMQQRKHKKARYAAAMENRRLRLLQSGATQWLLVADQMSALRKNFAVQQQTKSVYDTYQLVLRCGLHWKHWALRHREGKEDSRPRGKSQPVSRPLITPRGMASSVLTTPRDTVGTSVIDVNVTPRDVGGVTTHGGTLPAQVSHKEDRELPAPIATASPGRSLFPGPGISTIDASVRPQLKTRARPRQPDFLAESLKRAGLFLGAHSSDVMEAPVHSNPGEPTPAAGGESRSRVAGPDTDTGVERLNLSNLSSHRTIVDTEPSRLISGRDDHSVPHSARSDQGRELRFQNQGVFTVPHSVRSDQGRELGFQNQDVVSEPFQRYQDEHQSMMTQGAAWDGGKQDCVVRPDCVSNKPVIDQTYQSHSVPNLTRKVKLMTPADFMRKEPLDTEHHGSGFTPRTTSVHDISACSEGMSVASTPRVLCQSTHHNHPLSETYSFKVGQFPGDITPRSTSSGVTTEVPSDKLSSLGFEAPSMQGVQKEIVMIRNRLKSYDQKKRKLRTMQKQLKQLSDWLTDMEAKGQRSDDEDVASARQEVLELSADVAALKTVVEGERGLCAGLVDRVKVLTTLLTSTGR